MAYSRPRSDEPGASRQIAYLYAPYFGARIARQADDKLNAGSLSQRPLVLLDDGGCVLAADERATTLGVASGQTERQAVARCPQALFKLATRYPILEAEATLLERVARYTTRWQPHGLGAIYLDTTGLSGNLLDWCVELGNEARVLGAPPSIGVAQGKFGASVAGLAAVPSTALILTPPTQPDFLAQQTASWLPLETDALAQLRYLGIRTLGQFARLPSAGVLARWGEAGRTAQRWVLGRDDRPVVLPSERPEVTARIEFDGALLDRDILLAALVRKAEALLAHLRGQMQVVGSLALTITRADRRVISVKRILQLPTATAQTVALALRALLERVTWDGEGATDASLTLGDITDAAGQQLSLFEAQTPRQALTATLDILAARYGPDAFRMAALTEPDHPLPERRISWQRFG